jgi:adenosylhomocysteine nucleosidase
VEKTVCHDFGALRPEGLERWPTGKAMVRDHNPLYLRTDPDLFKRAVESGERIKLPASATWEGERTPQIVTGILASGDLFITDSRARRELWESLRADIVDMEAEWQSQTTKANGGVISTTR